MAIAHGERLGTRRAALWWLGWHPAVAAVAGGVAGLSLANALAVLLESTLGVGALDSMGAGTALGLVVGVVVWYRGTLTVNRTYAAVVSAARAGTRSLDSDAETFVLLGAGSGTGPLVRPNRRYEATVLTLESDATDVETGVFDLVDRRFAGGGSAMRLPYASIQSVDYDGSAFLIETVEGDRFAYDVTTDPEQLRSALRSRAEG